jgi:hypothetical protein
MDWKDLPNGKPKYHRYLASREWAKLKVQVRKRSGGTCERCRKAPGDSVHHLSYERVFRESLDDLLHVCNPCHAYLSGEIEDDPAAVENEQDGIERAHRMASALSALSWVIGAVENGDDANECFRMVTSLSAGFENHPDQEANEIFVEIRDIIIRENQQRETIAKMEENLVYWKNAEAHACHKYIVAVNRSDERHQRIEELEATIEQLEDQVDHLSGLRWEQDRDDDEARTERLRTIALASLDRPKEERQGD